MWKICTKRSLSVLVILMVGLSGFPQQTISNPQKNIRAVSQHFTDSKDITPWTFAPQDNIKTMDTSERPGLLTVWEAGHGKDIQGVLKDHTKIDEYPMPWEFQLQYAQNQMVFKAATTDKNRQLNYAIGVNLAV